ncbi:Arylsulfatase [Trichostrongylus colubriformis]|uniref:Arylsulfatase n=1 Tax=Trichostrongylus colubriformis TaxID=6319 RepID=A0AAN8FZ35_TRICO
MPYCIDLPYNCEWTTRKNVILIVTDDQDIELGSMQYMPKVSRLMKEKGTEFRGGFVSTPICCPSRSSLLTGMYVHNHNVHTNNHNCSGEEWRKTHEPRSIGVYMKEAGYHTAYLGKYLNEYEGNYVPPGWDYWMGLVKNSKFYNYTINLNGNRVKYGAEYEKDYFTDLVSNYSLKFIVDHFLTHSDVPFFLVISYPAPHGPEDPAPQYAHLFEDIDSHRTDSWNYAPNPDKQWLLQRTGKMEPVHVAFTDLLHRRRMQTLQSVDDGVHQIFSTLRDYNYLSSTYAIYTSDHGYHLGQFGLIKGKNMPYEFDIRVPFFLRGPGVMKNFSIREPVMNVDIAPTLISIAGGNVPDHMDGRNLLELIALKKAALSRKMNESSLPAPWRDTVLIERGKMPKLRKIRDRWLNQKERYGKEVRLNEACSKPEWQRPCSGTQQWSCYRSSDDRWRILKCRDRKSRNCACEKRQKRSTEQSGDQDLVDEFILHVHEYNILRSKGWYQGTFGARRSRRRRSLCSCRNPSLHPLKYEEFSYRPATDATEGPRKRKDRGNSSHPVRLSCSVQQMNCFLHSNDHWKTPPLWPDEYGQFCFCQNSNNNTYWCLRTINEAENYLYCEFVTEFVSYYDLNEDPYQLHNIVYSLEMSTLERLSERLQLLRECKGASCERYSNTDWEQRMEKPLVDSHL